MLIMLASFAHGAALITVEPPSPKVGEIAVLKVAGLTMEKGAAAYALFNERRFPLCKDAKGELSGLIAIDRDAKAGVRKLEIFAGLGEAQTKAAELTVRVASRKFEEQHLKVDQKTVELSPEDETRAFKEKELINGALSGRRPDRLWRGDFARPLEGEVSSTFGLKRFYNGRAGSYHGGIDIAAARGTPVKAAADGVLVLAGNYFFTGNTVFVDHGFGLFTAYFHMDEINGVNGAKLKKGAIIGKVGSTGRSTGAHLHWSVYLCGVKVDPESLLNAPLAKLAQAETP